MSKIKTFGKNVLFQVKKHSPEILIVAGVTGTVVSAVMACRATLKLNDILGESKETIKKIHEVKEEVDETEELAGKYTEQDVKKDLTITYIQTGIKVAKLYAPSVILGTLSLGAIVTSNGILRKRNAALATAYLTVSEGFKEYRGRVIEKFGQEIDKELKYGVKAAKVEEVVTDENGKEKKVKKTVGVSDISKSPYTFYFDSSSPYYETNDDYNMMFLRSIQQYANDQLRTNPYGILTLNSVLDSLGIQGTDEQRRMGMVVGWKYEKDNQIGDNNVDFGITEGYRETEDGRVEPCIILDFNVDGNVYDRV